MTKNFLNANDADQQEVSTRTNLEIKQADNDRWIWNKVLEQEAERINQLAEQQI